MRKVGALFVATAIAGCTATERADTRAVVQPFVVEGSTNAPAVLPNRAGQPLRISAGADTWIEVTPLDVHAVARSDERGASIYRGARAEADLAYTTGARHVEELWVLHNAAPLANLRWRVAHGAGIASITSYGGGLVARDTHGVAVLHAARPFVVDAAGVRRDAAFTLTGDRLELDVDLTGLRAPIVIDPIWALDANMSVPRMFHTATPLPSGDVFVVGGLSYASGTVEHSSAERYDVATRAFVAMPAMRDARYGHTATTLASGRILVAAGSDRSTAERFDPATSTWAATGPMRAPRTYHVAARLTDGRVLVAGGSMLSKAISHAEIYDPATDAWTAVAPMNVPRTYHRGVRLADGRVLVTGGLDGAGSAVASTELYDPATNTWSLAASMALARERHELALLPSGKAIVFGGQLSTTDTAASEGYDPIANTWSSMPPLPQRSVLGGHVVLADDTIVAVTSPAGWSTSATARFVPSKGTWTSDGALRTRRQGAAIAALPGGGVLVTGGSNPLEKTTATTESNLPSSTPGAACLTAADCVSGHCIDRVCCDRACGTCETCAAFGSEGTCVPRPDGPWSTCPIGRCAAGACSLSCATDYDCASSRCRDGTCVERLPKGSACTDARDCATGYCVEGVCCTGSCSGPCGTCTAAGAVGTCTYVTGAPIRGECPKGFCDGSFANSAGTCNGTLASCTSTFKSCDPFACRAGTCLTTCLGDGDCSSGRVCVDGSCRTASVPQCNFDGTAALDARGREVPCAPFLCIAGQCTDQCPTGKCATGMSCFSGVCVRTTAGERAEKFGGAFGCATGGPGESPWFAMLLCAGLLLRRRASSLDRV